MKKKEALARLAKQCEDDPEVTYQYAYTLERLRKYREAARVYEKATKLGPENSKYYFGLGDVCRVMGKYKEALAAYEKGLEHSPGDRRVERYVAELREKVKKIEEQELAKKKIAQEEEKKRKEAMAKVRPKPTPTPIPTPKKIERPSITLTFERPYSGRISLAGVMKRIIETKKIDTRMGRRALTEFSRRKATDEKIFSKSQIE